MQISSFVLCLRLSMRDREKVTKSRPRGQRLFLLCDFELEFTSLPKGKLWRTPRAHTWKQPITFPCFVSVDLQTWETKWKVCLCFDFIFRMGITRGVDVPILPARLLDARCKKASDKGNREKQLPNLSVNCLCSLWGQTCCFLSSDHTYTGHWLRCIQAGHDDRCSIQLQPLSISSSPS